MKSQHILYGLILTTLIACSTEPKSFDSGKSGIGQTINYLTIDDFEPKCIHHTDMGDPDYDTLESLKRLVKVYEQCGKEFVVIKYADKNRISAAAKVIGNKIYTYSYADGSWPFILNESHSDYTIPDEEALTQEDWNVFDSMPSIVSERFFERFEHSNSIASFDTIGYNYCNPTFTNHGLIVGEHCMPWNFPDGSQLILLTPKSKKLTYRGHEILTEPAYLVPSLGRSNKTVSFAKEVKKGKLYRIAGLRNIGLYLPYDGIIGENGNNLIFWSVNIDYYEQIKGKLPFLDEATLYGQFPFGEEETSGICFGDSSRGVYDPDNGDLVGIISASGHSQGPELDGACNASVQVTRIRSVEPLLQD